jgi:hypothetical protein
MAHGDDESVVLVSDSELLNTAAAIVVCYPKKTLPNGLGSQIQAPGQWDLFSLAFSNA